MDNNILLASELDDIVDSIENYNNDIFDEYVNNLRVLDDDEDDILKSHYNLFRNNTFNILDYGPVYIALDKIKSVKFLNWFIGPDVITYIDEYFSDNMELSEYNNINNIFIQNRMLNDNLLNPRSIDMNINIHRNRYGQINANLQAVRYCDQLDCILPNTHLLRRILMNEDIKSFLINSFGNDIKFWTSEVLNPIFINTISIYNGVIGKNTSPYVDKNLVMPVKLLIGE